MHSARFRRPRGIALSGVAMISCSVSVACRNLLSGVSSWAGSNSPVTASRAQRCIKRMLCSPFIHFNVSRGCYSEAAFNDTVRREFRAEHLLVIAFGDQFGHRQQGALVGRLGKFVDEDAGGRL